MVFNLTWSALSRESCEVHIKEEWLQGGLTPWVDGVEEVDVGVVYVDGTQTKKPCLS